MVGLHYIGVWPREDGGFGFAARADVALGATTGGGFSGDASGGVGLALHARRATALALLGIGGDKYGGANDMAYAIPGARYRSYELRLHVAVWVPWIVEGGIAEVVRDTSDKTGPTMRPAGAPAGMTALNELRLDVRVFRAAWFGGLASLSTVDASAISAELGRRF
jgi:hypothetical protein